MTTRIWSCCHHGHVFVCEGACYDTTTVGAFTAYAHKFKHGGLRRLLRQLREHVAEDEDGQTRLEKVNQILANMSSVRTLVDGFCEAVCRSAIQTEAAELGNTMATLADKVETEAHVGAGYIMISSLKVSAEKVHLAGFCGLIFAIILYWEDLV